jgi:phytoene synthase
MISTGDMAHYRASIRTGSLSFHAASRLLPPRVRDPALALYAFGKHPARFPFPYLLSF